MLKYKWFQEEAESFIAWCAKGISVASKAFLIAEIIQIFACLKGAGSQEVKGCSQWGDGAALLTGVLEGNQQKPILCWLLPVETGTESKLWGFAALFLQRKGNVVPVLWHPHRFHNPWSSHAWTLAPFFFPTFWGLLPYCRKMSLLFWVFFAEMQDH